MSKEPYMSIPRCHICGCSIAEIGAHNRYLRRVNNKGEIGIWECTPSCKTQFESSEDTLIAALEGRVS